MKFRWRAYIQPSKLYYLDYIDVLVGERMLADYQRWKVAGCWGVRFSEFVSSLVLGLYRKRLLVKWIRMKLCLNSFLISLFQCFLLKRVGFWISANLGVAFWKWSLWIERRTSFEANFVHWTMISWETVLVKRIPSVSVGWLKDGKMNLIVIIYRFTHVDTYLLSCFVEMMLVDTFKNGMKRPKTCSFNKGFGLRVEPRWQCSPPWHWNP